MAQQSNDVSSSSSATSELQAAIHNLLNAREQIEFVEILTDYHGRRNVQVLTESLQVLLDTPAKRHLITLLRQVIPQRDLLLFDQRMMGTCEGEYSTTSLRRSLGTHTLSKSTRSLPVSMPHRYYQSGTAGQNGRPNSAMAMHPSTSWDPVAMSSGGDIKRIYMEQSSSPQSGLGFSIRGGAEHGIGIYVSYVDVESVAERQGLTPGDQILTVNDISLLKVTHKEAARVSMDRAVKYHLWKMKFGEESWCVLMYVKYLITTVYYQFAAQRLK